MGNDIADNTFFEVQAEKFYQKKVEVARGVIELGQILIETKKGFKGAKGEWTRWLEDGRVNFTVRTAQNYMERTNYFEIECVKRGLNDKNETCFVFEEILNDLTHRQFQTLKSAPEEVKEDVANSKDKEEAEKKIKEYEEQLKQEKLAKDVLIKNNEELQRQLEREKKTKKTEYITNEVVVEPSDYSFIKDRLHELECNNKALEDEKDEEIERLNDELDKYRQLDMCQQDVEDRLNRQVKIIEKLDREEEILESWGEVMGELDLIIAKINVVSRSTYSLNNKGENAIKKSALYCSNRLKEIYTYLDETFEPSTVDINCVEPEFECIEGE